MNPTTNEAVAAGSAKVSTAGLRSHEWQRFLRGPDPELLEKLYVPSLSEAIRYDRCCSYFSSGVLAAAARGFGKLIERLLAMGEEVPRPAIRLVVNEELSRNDVRAMIETGDVTELENLLKKRLKAPREILEKRRLEMLGWLVSKGWLEVRVGVMRQGDGIVHAKYGIVTDEKTDSIVFSGSGNESALGLVANYERLEISTSWDDPDRYNIYRQEFDTLWHDTDPLVHTVPLPEALKQELIRFAPEEPPISEPSNVLARQKAAMLWQFIVEAPYLPETGAAACDAMAPVDLWPHQRQVVEETAAAWPSGRLLCDEVGMGKTIEAILVLRRLLAGRGVRRALLLVPKGILKQWQSELREKGGLIVPRLEGQNVLVWPDDRTQHLERMDQAFEQDLLLMSRETARMPNNREVLVQAQPWDLVLLDEAHAARRKEAEEGEFNQGTLLLDLLRVLQLRKRTRGILLLSATPMQTQPWEPWDLLGTLGEGGAWLVEFNDVRLFYQAISAVKEARCDLRTAQSAAQLIAADESFPIPPGNHNTTRDVQQIARELVFAPPATRSQIAQWLRTGSPLHRRMHRNTRRTLREYYRRGLLPDPPAERQVDDVRFDYLDVAERNLYHAITAYINKRYEELEHEKAGKGFVMTVYRRRASSSPLALKRSLQRRRDGLRRVAQNMASDYELPVADVPEALDLDELPEADDLQVSSALPSDPKVAAAEIEEIDHLLSRLSDLGNTDTKRDRFLDELRRVTDDGRALLIFTEYTDTMEYIRDALLPHYGKTLGTYCGDGGAMWDGTAWSSVGKDVITDSLQRGDLKALVCTDAASEGLNLQAAGALINYDLPWNPSRVEQRIGRIDRIGQKFPLIRIVNMLLRDSVDDQVYHALRYRCGLFEHFVGAMQPVLSLARRMLLSPQSTNTTLIGSVAGQIKSDPLANETYIESEAKTQSLVASPVNREHVVGALTLLDGTFGPLVKHRKDGIYEFRVPGSRKRAYGIFPKVLESKKDVLPFSVYDSFIRDFPKLLSKTGERLPLVIASTQSNSFRTSVVMWVDGNSFEPISTYEDLHQRIQSWNGAYPDTKTWQAAYQEAQRRAEEHIAETARRAYNKQALALSAQIAAAKLRLMRELGRYLVCVSGTSATLNSTLRSLMQRDRTSADRLRHALERLETEPEWSPDLCRELDQFLRDLPPNKRQARLLGSELDAALRDPRWMAANHPAVRSI
jgi:superfamily II DNA or RNA helicase